MATTFFAPVQEDLKQVETLMRAQADLGHHPDVRAALEHLMAAGGKRIRPTLGILIGKMLDADHGRMITLGAAVEMLDRLAKFYLANDKDEEAIGIFRWFIELEPKHRSGESK